VPRRDDMNPMELAGAYYVMQKPTQCSGRVN